MNASAFRHFYNYHFSENRNIWDNYVSQLSDEQLTQTSGYSHGSLRAQIIHLISVDEAWFSDLGAIERSETFDPAELTDRESIRAYWDTVEEQMRAYLAALRDDMLFDKPLQGEDEALILWQVLLQVVNHGTDHRAQLLRQINDLGVKTTAQDYIFYAYENPITY